MNQLFRKLGQPLAPFLLWFRLAGQNWQNWLTCLFFPSTIFEILWFTVESPVYALHTARNSNVDSNAPLLDLPEKKSGYAFGYNETLLLISLYQKYETFSVIFPSRKRQFSRSTNDRSTSITTRN